MRKEHGLYLQTHPKIFVYRVSMNTWKEIILVNFYIYYYKKNYLIKIDIIFIVILLYQNL